MSKSSRYAWLHGMILLAAVVGCKSNSNNTCSECAAHGGAGMPAAAGYAGTVSTKYPQMGGGTMYSAGGTPSYAGTQTTGTAYPSTNGGASYPTSTGGAANYTGANR
jgi:hypothetical protein